MKTFTSYLFLFLFGLQTPLISQVFIAPYYGHGVNYINNTNSLSPIDRDNLEISSIGINLDIALNHYLYFKGFVQYSDGDDLNVSDGQFQRNLSSENGIETATMLSYRYMNTSLDFGPGYNYMIIVLRDYNNGELNYLKGNANLITANAQASMYFRYGLSTHFRMSHRVNSLSWYSDEAIQRSIDKYLYAELRLAINIPIKKLRWRPKVRMFKQKRHNGNCPEITI